MSRQWLKRRPGRHRGDTVQSVQHRWLDCCQSIEAHRFDCGDVPQEQRGAGPFGPVAATTLRQMVDVALAELEP